MIVNFMVHTTQICHLVVLEVRFSKMCLLQSEGRKEKDVAIFGSSERGSSIIQPTTKEEQELSEKLSLAPST